MSSCFLLLKSNLYCLYTLGCVTIKWIMVNLVGVVLLEKTDFLSASNYQLPTVPYSRVRLCAHHLSSCWNFAWLELMQILCMLPQSLWLMQHCWLLLSSCPLFCHDPWTWGWVGVILTEHSMVFYYSRYFGQLWGLCVNHYLLQKRSLPDKGWEIH